MATPYLGTIMQVGFNFAPRGWAFCNGQILPISQNTALFSLIGTYYGGNGSTTFALPNIQSRTSIGQGQGPGLQPYSIGQAGGTQTQTLSVLQMPIHNHAASFTNSSTLSATTADGSLQQPAAGALLAKGIDTDPTPDLVPFIYAPGGSSNPVSLANIDGAGTVTVQPNGSNQPFAHLAPYNTLNFIIALEGIFPSRN